MSTECSKIWIKSVRMFKNMGTVLGIRFGWRSQQTPEVLVERSMVLFGYLEITTGCFGTVKQKMPEKIF